MRLAIEEIDDDDGTNDRLEWTVFGINVDWSFDNIGTTSPAMFSFGSAMCKRLHDFPDCVVNDRGSIANGGVKSDHQSLTN